jgi:2-keto-3-deoxy-L-rhamnonate aldolase RhmA
MVFNPNFASPALVEHAGALGFDVAFIDGEHGSAMHPPPLGATRLEWGSASSNFNVSI